MCRPYEHKDANNDDGVNMAGATATTNKKRDHRGKSSKTTKHWMKENRNDWDKG